MGVPELWKAESCGPYPPSRVLFLEPTYCRGKGTETLINAAATADLQGHSSSRDGKREVRSGSDLGGNCFISESQMTRFLIFISVGFLCLQQLFSDKDLWSTFFFLNGVIHTDDSQAHFWIVAFMDTTQSCLIKLQSQPLSRGIFATGPMSLF